MIIGTPRLGFNPADWQSQALAAQQSGSSSSTAASTAGSSTSGTPSTGYARRFNNPIIAWAPLNGARALPVQQQQQTVQTGTSASGSTVAQTTPPGNYPTDEPYTDAAGNIWTWNPTSGWQITTPAGSSSSAASGTDWLTQQTIITGLPNWGVVGAIGLGVLLLMRKR